MNSTTIKQEFILTRSIKPILQYLRIVLPLLVIMMLAACSNRVMYTGTCRQQTRQFVDHVRSMVIDELNPVIETGLNSGPTAEVNNRLLELDEKVFELNTPECNPGTKAAKDSLRQYMLEARNYFNVVAGRAVYGEGQVQGQLSKVYETKLAFETVVEDLLQ